MDNFNPILPNLTRPLNLSNPSNFLTPYPHTDASKLPDMVFEAI